MSKEFFPPRPEVTPTIYAYESTHPQLKGMLRIGYTSRDAKTRVAEQHPNFDRMSHRESLGLISYLSSPQNHPGSLRPFCSDYNTDILAIMVSKHAFPCLGKRGARNPYVNALIVEAVERELTSRGLTKVNTDPDLKSGLPGGDGSQSPSSDFSFYHVVNPAYSGMVGSATMNMWVLRPARL